MVKRPEDAPFVVGQLCDEQAHQRCLRKVEVAAAICGKMGIEALFCGAGLEVSPVDDRRGHLSVRQHFLARLGDVLPAEPRAKDWMTLDDVPPGMPESLE